MIAKCIKGTGFRGAVAYDLQPHKSLLLETNMAGQTPRELAKEFGAIRVLRPKLSKAVCHVSISLSPEEHLNDEQWRHVAQTWLEEMGFSNSQYIVSRHTNAAHDHIHILANRVTFDGKVVSDAHDYKRQEVIMRRLEKELGLRVLQSSHEGQRAALCKGEVEKALRTGNAPIRTLLQELVDAALMDFPSVSSFCHKLYAWGVEVRLNQATTGRISGISFAKDGVAFKGSKLGKGYTWKGLQERGLRHEQDGLSTRHGREADCQSQDANNGTNNLSRWGASTTRSTAHGLEPSGRGENQELAGVNQAFEAIKQHYRTDSHKRSRSRSRGQKLS